jgi:hypothetical protein
MEPEGSLPCSQKLANFEALCNVSQQAGFLRWGVASL